MCPVASPVGADGGRGEGGAPLRPRAAGAVFSRVAACRIVGFAPSALKRWEKALADEAGRPRPAVFTVFDLLALSVIREVETRLGDRASGFTVGLGEVFGLLSAQVDLQRLDPFAVLVGPDFARLAELRADHVRCVGDGFVVVPFNPILEDLRGRAIV